MDKFVVYYNFAPQTKNKNNENLDSEDKNNNTQNRKSTHTSWDVNWSKIYTWLKKTENRDSVIILFCTWCELAFQVQFIKNNQISFTYKQISLVYIKNNNINILLSFVSEFLLAIIKNLEKHFPNRELYYAIQIFNLQELPESDNNLANYRNIEINLKNFYGNDKIISEKNLLLYLTKEFW
ncbi:44198_t:CDS:2 [Gigaspora margarita]|uniref:44198_t:CDS:1 n=1 Tax=Gigaspora margarita TaxID=4874 RepID=A0ABN7WCE0_GIGMA|nr:44198_t:CDS:2 [Gigaspora margarita]